MNLLQDGIKNGSVILSEQVRKLTIDGETKPYSVYKIDLQSLFYNDQNDRIATWLSKYKEEGNEFPKDMEQYNLIIEDFIIKSNPESIKKTKNNIEMFNQREPGVVLTDGRVIDGNRRFTCLRQLNKENPQFRYFEAVILDKDINTNKKEIKLLELMIQHGEESKIDYNPIDRLVGIYNDVIKEPHLISEEEYIQSANMEESEFKKKYKEAELMIEFLEFINAKDKFYIARELELDGPLVELVGILNATPLNQKEDIKHAVFNALAINPHSDMTRYVRNIKKVVKHPEVTKTFIEEQQKISEKLLEILDKKDIEINVINEIRKDKQLTEDTKKSFDKAIEIVGLADQKNVPLNQTQKALDVLQAIDIEMIKKMDEDSLEKMQELIVEIRDLLADLENMTNA